MYSQFYETNTINGESKASTFFKICLDHFTILTDLRKDKSWENVKEAKKGFGDGNQNTETTQMRLEQPMKKMTQYNNR